MYVHLLKKLCSVIRFTPWFMFPSIYSILREWVYSWQHVSKPAYLFFQGADIFCTPVNIEVQWTCEASIAAIERVGGVITTRYYDGISVQALSDALTFFKRGVPIPRCPLPPSDAIEYYTDPKSRGYLADPEEIIKERFKLAQKYGYELPDLSQNPLYDMLLKRKDPRQIFWGLNPGWVVCLKDKVVIKPKEEDYIEYYKS